IAAARSIKDKNDRACLLNLIALIAVKNPRHRETHRQVYKGMVKMMMELATATPERWASQVHSAKADGFIAEGEDADYEKMRAFIKADEYQVRMTTDYHLSLEMESFDNVLPYFFHRKWVLIRAPQGKTGFVTSDHPVCLMWSDPAERGGFHG